MTQSLLMFFIVQVTMLYMLLLTEWKSVVLLSGLFISSLSCLPSFLYHPLLVILSSTVMVRDSLSHLLLTHSTWHTLLFPRHHHCLTLGLSLYNQIIVSFKEDKQRANLFSYSLHLLNSFFVSFPHCSGCLVYIWPMAASYCGIINWFLAPHGRVS